MGGETVLWLESNPRQRHRLQKDLSRELGRKESRDPETTTAEHFRRFDNWRNIEVPPLASLSFFERLNLNV